MLVVLAIITFLMSIILTSQSSFNKSFVLENTAYDIALTLRDAEIFGLGSRGVDAVSNVGYGLHFDTGSPGSFLLFADTYTPASCGMPNCKPGDKIYTSDDVLRQTYTLGNGITVNDFCVFNGTNWSCAYSNGSTLNSLDIVFARPNPDAFIRVNSDTLTSYSKTCVSLTSPQGGARFVSVSLSGEIKANASSCP